MRAGGILHDMMHIWERQSNANEPKTEETAIEKKETEEINNEKLFYSCYVFHTFLGVFSRHTTPF